MKMVGKTPQAGLITPLTKKMQNIHVHSPDANKENIPPSSCLRSSTRKSARKLYVDDEEVLSNNQSSRRMTRSSSRVRDATVTPSKRNVRKRNPPSESDRERNDATPTKKSPGLPSRNAKAVAHLRIQNNTEYDMETLAMTKRNRGKKVVLEVGNHSKPVSRSQRGVKFNVNDSNLDESDIDENTTNQQDLRRSSRRSVAPVVFDSSPIEKRLTRMALRTPDRKIRNGEVEAVDDDSHRRRTPSRTVKEAKTISYTPVKEFKIKMILKKVAETTYRVRTGDTPRTPARQRAPLVSLTRSAMRKKDRDMSYEPESMDKNEDDSEDEEISSSESSEEEEEEEEEEDYGIRRTRSARRSVVTRTPSRGPSSTKKSKICVRVESEEPDFDIDLSTAPLTLAAALERLSTTRCPRGTLLCRDKECAEIRDFVKAAVAPKGRSQACYISGVPGTGKTASVMAMVRELRSNRSTTPFVFIPVNAMYFTDAKQLFAEVWYEYAKQTNTEEDGKVRRLAGGTARKKLNSLFETIDRSRPSVLILIDELDQLSTKKQELIYDIFNWTTIEAARVSVISIANTLDLPERMLSQRITSRLGMNRIVFQPYSHEEIKMIISAKLGGNCLQSDDSIVESDAVQLASRKVAAISGDLRKALDIVRVAVEMAIVRGEQKLTMTLVNESIRTASSTLLVHTIHSLSIHQFIIFDSIVEIIRSRDVEDFTMTELIEKYGVMCRMQYEKEPLREEAVWRFLLHLAGCAMIAFTNPSEPCHFRRRIRLLPAVHDAVSGIKISSERRKAAEANIPVHQRWFK